MRAATHPVPPRWQRAAPRRGDAGLRACRWLWLLVLCWAPLRANDLADLEARLSGLQGDEYRAALVELAVGLRQDAPAKALAYGGQALERLRDTPDPAAEVEVRNEMGWAAMVLGDYPRAVELAQSGRALAVQTGNAAGEARALNNLGVIARTRGHPAAAIPDFEQALALYARLGMRREEAGVLNNLGVVHGFDLADYASALDYQLRALEIRRGLGDDQDLALSYNNIGVIYTRLGDAGKAAQHFQQALDIRRRLGSPARIAGTLHNLGDLYIDLGEWSRALGYHEEALSLREQAGDHAGMLISLIALGTIHAKAGQPARARPLLERALAESASEREQMLARLALARLEHQVGDLPTARAQAGQAIALAERTQALDSARQAWQELAAIHEDGHDYAAALQAFKQFKATSDRILDDERSRRIDLFESRYQAERREREIASLRSVQAERELQSSRRRWQRDALAAVAALAVVVTVLLYRRRRALEGLNRQLAEASQRDSLTGLHNRRHLQQRMAALQGGADPQAAAVPGLFLLVDIDHFKQVNDRYGHSVGDRVLQRFAGVLAEACREGDSLVRWGGEEFLLYARLDGEPAGFARQLHAAVAATRFDLGNGRLERLGCSIGFAVHPLDRAQPRRWSWEQTVAVADAALYVAKRSGRDAWVGITALDAARAPGPAGFAPDLATLARLGAVQVATSLPGVEPACWDTPEAPSEPQGSRRSPAPTATDPPRPTPIHRDEGRDGERPLHG